MPNILITGTPGTGKTTLAQAIVAAHPQMRHIELSKVIAEQELHEGRDEHFDTLIMDDDKVVDYLEDVMDIHKHRNTIVDFHTSDFFPERWFDLVIVLRTDAAPHYERLEAKYVPITLHYSAITLRIVPLLLETNILYCFFVYSFHRIQRLFCPQNH